MKIRSYLTEETQDLSGIIDKVEYIKITNKNTFVKAEIKTKDNTFQNFSEKNIKILLKTIYKRIKEY